MPRRLGYANTNLSYYYSGDGVYVDLGDHKFTDLALGGGVDLKLTRRFSIRAFDFEYQDYSRSSRPQRDIPKISIPTAPA